MKDIGIILIGLAIVVVVVLAVFMPWVTKAKTMGADINSKTSSISSQIDALASPVP